MSARFEVQEYTLCDGWINTWSDEEGNPSRFDTDADAWDELEAFFMDMQDAYNRGDMADVPDAGDYRIVEIERA